MKKTCFVFVFFTFINLFSFGQAGLPEDLGFLLFLPNSSSEFADEDQSIIYLDNTAEILMNRNLNPGQIHVNGYAALGASNYDLLDLSLERALFVINELVKRGIPEESFAEPEAFGSVDLWGNNENEQGRSPNRRVRIILDDMVLTPQEPPQEVPLLAPIPAPININGSGFPWMLLPLILILLAIILFLALKTGKKETIKENAAPTTFKEAARAPVIEAAPAPIVPPAAPAAITYTVVNLEDEIRFRAFALYLERDGHNGDEYGDWCKAVLETCTRYEANGYETYTENESWWARLNTDLKHLSSDQY